MRISTNMQDDIKKVLLTEEQIKKRVKEMGEQLSKEYMDKRVILICILKGAAPFFTDLVREMDCSFIESISRLRQQHENFGHSQNRKGCRHKPYGQACAYRRGYNGLGSYAKASYAAPDSRNPASMKIACLLDKKERRECDITPDYCGLR